MITKSLVYQPDTRVRDLVDNLYAAPPAAVAAMFIMANIRLGLEGSR